MKRFLSCSHCNQPMVLPLVEHNGEMFCSGVCHRAHQAQEREMRTEARQRMEMARDRRGQLSVGMSGALVCLLLAWCLLGGYQQAEANVSHWKGDKLRISGGAR